MKHTWNKLALAVVVSLMAGTGIAAARSLTYGIFYAYDAEARSLYRGGGSGTIRVSKDGGTSYSTIANLHFGSVGRAYAYLGELDQVGEDAVVELSVTYDEGPEGTPLPVSIKESKSDFLARFRIFWSGYFGYTLLPVTYPEEGNIVDVAKADGRFKTLVAALELTGLDEALQGEGPFTVFAPTDTAFEAIPEEVFAGLLENIPELRDILLYHVLGEDLKAAAVVAEEKLQTLLGPTVKVTVNETGVYINESQVIIQDIPAANGTIHVLNAVLLPPPNIVETAKAAGIFTTLVTALETTGLDDVLAGEGPFTVFAPTDAAFAALGQATIDALLQDTETLAEILQYHVLSGRVTSGAVIAAGRLTTLLGADVEVTVEGDTVKINDAVVRMVDIEARNGIVHVIDAVLLPPTEPSILEIARSAGTFTTLIGALEATGLDEVLSGEGPFTVFAPTDEAFARLPRWLLNRVTSDPELLKKVLLYHVVAGELDAETLLRKRWVKTVNGAYVYVFDYRGTVFVGRSRVSAADVTASNGIIHAIDSVLIPYNLFR